jgi:large subunit ribosomal protein L20
MPRVRKGAARHRKHKRVLRAARGYHGAASRRYRTALQAVFRAGVHATRDRKRRKRDFRRLWVTRISAACRQRGILYSRLVYALEMADIRLNRKMLSEIAIADPAAFDEIVRVAFAGEPQAEAPAEPTAKAPAETAAQAEAPAEPTAEPEAKKKTAPKARKKAPAKDEKPADEKAPAKAAKKAPKKKAKKKTAKKKAKKKED